MRSLHTRTQLQQTQFTKTKKYGLRVMVGLLISALVVGTGQMTAQPTHALAPVVLAPVITAKEVLTVGAFLLYASLKHQQHETARKKLEAQCEKPVNNKRTLCQPLKDNTKPIPLADIQKWITEKCKKDFTCIQKLVQGIEISFKSFTKMPIQLGPTLCTHSNFTLLAETLEQYCKKGGFLPSKLGKPKPGGTSGIGGKTRVSSSAPLPSTGGRGKTPTENKYLGTDSALGKIVKNALKSAEKSLKLKIRDYRRLLDNYSNYNEIYKKRYPYSYFQKNLETAEGNLKFIKEIREKFVLLQDRTKVLKSSTIKDDFGTIQNQNDAIQRELGELKKEYEEYKSKKSVYPLGIESELGKKLTLEIQENIELLKKSDQQNKKLIWELEQLLDEILDLQDPLEDEISRMQLIPKEKKEALMKKMQKIHEEIQEKLKEIDAKYRNLLRRK